MSRHTPGPWYADSVAREWGFKAPVLMARVTREAEKDGLRLPVVWADPRYVRYEETVANARLIASAPDLLRVLSEMVEMMDSGNEHGAGSAWHTEATAAIAKARGEDK